MTTLTELSRRVSEAEGPSRERDVEAFRLGVLCYQKAVIQMKGFYNSGTFGRLAYPDTRGKLAKNSDEIAAALLAIHERNKSDE